MGTKVTGCGERGGKILGMLEFRFKNWGRISKKDQSVPHDFQVALTEKRIHVNLGKRDMFWMF